MNKFIGIGRLTSKPELRYTNSQTAYTRFTLAINRAFNREETDFINCIAWRKTAELICEYFDKGSQIGVEGEVQTGNYENKEGQKVYTTEINVERIEFLNNKNSEKKKEESTSPYDFQEEDIYASMGERISIEDADID